MYNFKKSIMIIVRLGQCNSIHLIIELRVCWQPELSMPFHPSRASWKEDILKVGRFSVYLHFPHGEPQMQVWIKCCTVFLLWVWLKFTFLTAYHILALKFFMQSWESMHKIDIFFFSFFILLRSPLWNNMKREGECTAETSFSQKLPRKKNKQTKKKTIQSQRAAPLQKMLQFICEKWETKQAKLEANLVFRAITKGNEANSLWQII